MHNSWEELIPYYVAGTLPKADAARLERHLAGCAECRKSLEEWRAIAGVVRADAASQLRDLPPLSASVLQAALRDTRRRQQAMPSPLPAPPRARASAAPATLIAALITVILLGGLLTVMVLRTPAPQPGASVAQNPTVTPTLSPSPTVIASATVAPPSPTASAFPSPQPQIIVVEPSSTPAFVPPTATVPTPIPPTRPLPTASIPTAAPPPTIAASRPPLVPAQAVSTQTCAIHVAVPGSVVNLYAAPGLDSAIVKTIGADDSLIALGKSDTGWFQAQYPPGNAQTVGWVREAQVYVSGSCDDLPLIPVASPSPTSTVIPFLPTLTPSPTLGSS